MSNDTKDNDEVSDYISNDYKTLSKLGEGSFSKVYKVKSRKTGALLAMKRFNAKFESIEQVQSLREIQALKRLNPHPNLMQVEEIVFNAELGILAIGFAIMDANLYDIISRKKAEFPLITIKKYFYQVCNALDFMHGKGIFHRDIKPENILIIESTQTVKLADLGSCRGIHSKQPYTAYVATRWYRSPECLLCDGLYSYKMDIWGAGCVLYEMITRNPLFPGNNELNQLNKIHNVIGTPLPSYLKQLMKSDFFRKDLKEIKFPPQEGSGIRAMMPGFNDADCIDLIERTLMYNPDDRLTARQVLNHEFLKEVAFLYNNQPSAQANTVTARPLSKNTQQLPSTIHATSKSASRGLRKLKPEQPPSVQTLQDSIAHDYSQSAESQETHKPPMISPVQRTSETTYSPSPTPIHQKQLTSTLPLPSSMYSTSNSNGNPMSQTMPTQFISPSVTKHKYKKTNQVAPMEHNYVVTSSSHAPQTFESNSKRLTSLFGIFANPLSNDTGSSSHSKHKQSKIPMKLPTLSSNTEATDADEQNFKLPSLVPKSFRRTTHRSNTALSNNKAHEKNDNDSDSSQLKEVMSITKQTRDMQI